MRQELNAAVANLINHPTGRDSAVCLNYLLANRQPVPPPKTRHAPGYRTAGVYGLFKHDELVYIGKATHISERVRTHAAKYPYNREIDFDTWAYIPVADWHRHALERSLVGMIKPLSNIYLTKIFTMSAK
jgi:hypothetical protein